MQKKKARFEAAPRPCDDAFSKALATRMSQAAPLLPRARLVTHERCFLRAKFALKGLI
jgi:hypothetical protein